jgi:hypothetical protein
MVFGDSLASDIELLVSQGHSFVDVQEYSLPQLRLFIQLAEKRIKLMLRLQYTTSALAFSGDKVQVKNFLKSLE